MKKYLEVLRQCPLFDHIADSNLEAMLSCLGAKIKIYGKETTILEEGTPASRLGIVLSGKAQVIRVDYYGNRSILATVHPSQMFGESFACGGASTMPVDVVALERCQAMLIDAHKIVQTCTNACDFHNQIIFNLLKIVAKKNILLNQKIEITSKRKTREKLMTYLLLQAKAANSNSFNIPYDRQGLADYLEVDRSGLSVEIGKMCREGIIENRRSWFNLVREQEGL